jgi:soluble lytic murein transglycosylase-like protein
MKEREFQGLVTSVIQAESSFNARAVSHRGAKGLMQLMDKTGQELYARILSTKDYNPYNPDLNRMLGSRYLRDLLNKYSDNVRLALAAYNWGMGNVDRCLNDEWRKQPLDKIEKGDHYNLIDLKLPKETWAYVDQVMGYYQKRIKGQRVASEPERVK